MKKIKTNALRQGPISLKVLARMKKIIDSKVIDISAWRNALLNAESLESTLISDKQLAELDPLHGVYVYGQNKISIILEQIAELPDLSKLTNAYINAEHTYMPSGPPTSPLTGSYFFCWGIFDLCSGMHKESFGSIIIDLCRYLNVDPGMIKIFESMQNSRMGFYVHEGSSGKYVFLRELISENRVKVIVPSGYAGDPGQIWLARIVPEPFPELNYGYSVIFTTPYIISEMNKGGFFYANEDKWLSFFERNLAKTGVSGKVQAYEYLMKYGLHRHYWNEYIFEGYVNYSKEMIILAGFPDDPISRPHSKENIDR